MPPEHLTCDIILSPTFHNFDYASPCTHWLPIANRWIQSTLLMCKFSYCGLPKLKNSNRLILLRQELEFIPQQNVSAIAIRRNTRALLHSTLISATPSTFVSALVLAPVILASHSAKTIRSKSCRTLCQRPCLPQLPCDNVLLSFSAHPIRDIATHMLEKYCKV